MKINEIKSEISHLKRTAFGVSVPELRKLAQKIAKENYQKFEKLFIFLFIKSVLFILLILLQFLSNSKVNFFDL